MGSRDYFRDFSGDRAFDRFTPNVAAFIAMRDTLFVATVTEEGWPYVRHRGGPPGFVTVIEERTLASADFRGNQQYLTAGNVRATGRAALIMVDFASRRRLKILGHIGTQDLDRHHDLATLLAIPGYTATIERAFVLHLDAYDLNCPQHITRRFTAPEMEKVLQPLRDRIRCLEIENAALRAGAA